MNSAFGARWLASSEVISQVLFTSKHRAARKTLKSIVFLRWPGKLTVQLWFSTVQLWFLPFQLWFLTVQLWFFAVQLRFLRQFQFCFCDLDDRDWDATYGTFSPVDIPPSPFWAEDAIIKQAVREEIGRQNSGGEREETLPGGITTSAPSQRSIVSRLSSLLDRIRGKKKGKKTNDRKEHRIQIEWIHYSEVSQTSIPVRQKNGGGNRYISYNAIQAPSIAFLGSSETSSFLDNSRYDSLLFKVDKPIYTLWCLEHCCITFLSVTLACFEGGVSIALLFWKHVCPCEDELVVFKKQEIQARGRDEGSEIHVEPGDHVYYKNYSQFWPARTGPVSCLVKGANGQMVKRHFSQLFKQSPPESPKRSESNKLHAPEPLIALDQ